MKSRLTLLFMSLLIVTTSCGKDDKTEPDEDMQGKNIIAELSFDNGTSLTYGGKILLKPTLMFNKGEAVELLVMSSTMEKDGITYDLSMIAGIDGKGTYHFIPNPDDQTGVNFTMNVGDSGDQLTVYAPARPQEDLLGSCTLNITSLTDTHMKATFSATLYSSTGKLVIKEGKIDTEIIRKEYEP